MLLAEILQSKYNTDNYRSLLNQLFGVKFKALATPDSLPVDTQFAKFAHLLGEITLSSGETIAIFEVSLQDNIQIEQNKVGIRNLLRKYWNKYDGAFIASYKNIETLWRFSFVSETRQFNEDGDYEKVATAAKRYTYLIGESQACRTANERLSKLNAHSTLDKIIEAFSVETLTKQFYKELFAWYEWALSDKDGFAVTFPNDTSTEADDRKIDEHIIRLITRLMFVWFIKQKSLIPNSIFDVKELKRILKTFEPSSKKEGNYYNAILQNLFFATLNKPINERAFANEGSHEERKEHYGVKTLFRNPKNNSWFNISTQEVLEVFKSVPFLNGGLFECLDKENEKGKVMYYDGFSREAGRQCRAFLPNCLFFDETKGLIPLLNKYNFTIEENTPTDIEVALDPELLGKVFENLLGAYNPETKDLATDRNNSGSFYTPRDIVNFMVDESLIVYLTKTCNDISEQTIRELFSLEDVLPEELQKDNTKCKVLADCLKHAKIIDPACGSGAFPMGILNRMVTILQKLHEEGEITTYDLKLHLIEQCIYGIDIQTIAVQISKLRFFISLICEQSQNNNIKDNYGITPLPNLETKFVAANTLISTNSNSKGLLDLNDTTLYELKENLWEIRQQHFYAKNADEKKKLRKQDEALREKIKAYLVQNASKPNEEFIQTCSLQIDKLKNERNEYLTENWVDETEKQVAQISLFEETVKKEPSIFRVDINKKKRDEIDSNIKELEKLIDKENKKSRNSEFEEEVEKLVLWNPYDQNTSSLFFDSEWMFDLKTGFSIVIGNPPYIQLQKNGGELAKLYQNKGFETFKSMGDIYCLFYEMGYRLLKQDGVLVYITSNKWMRAGYGDVTRKFLATKTNPILLIDFAGQKIFEAATVDTNILLYTKAKNTGNTQACVVKEKYTNKLSDFIRQNALDCSFNTEESWVVLSAIEQQIKEKIERIGTPLKKWDIQINYGIKTGFNEAFIINGTKKDELIAADPKSAEIIRPILRGKDIKRYSYVFADKWLICTHNGIKDKEIKRINIDDYPAIKAHLDKYYDQLSIRSDKGDTPYNLRNCAYMEDFFKQKIVWKAVGRNLAFSLLEEGSFITAPASFITSQNNLYLLGLLCSNYAKYFILNNSDTTGAGDVMLNIQSLSEIPIPRDIDYKYISEKVNLILSNKNQGIATKGLETDINKEIYKIFSFTNEEIKFIELQ